MSKSLLDSHNLKSTVDTYDNSTLPIYTVTIHKNEDGIGYWAKCYVNDDCAFTDGDTIRELQINMFESMDLCLEDYPYITDYILQFKVCDE